MRSERPTVALTLGMRRHWWVARKDLILLPPSKTIPQSKSGPESLQGDRSWLLIKEQNEQRNRKELWG